MDDGIEVFQCVGHAAGAHVSLIVPVDSQCSSNASQQNEVMKVKLSAFVEKRSLYVLLKQERPRLIRVLQYFPQFLHYFASWKQLNLVLVVAAFSRFDEPQFFLVL